MGGWVLWGDAVAERSASQGNNTGNGRGPDAQCWVHDSGLVNNAHLSGLTNVTVTQDNCECTYQVNHLSHFLLTLLLLPCLSRGRSNASPEKAASVVHGTGPTHPTRLFSCVFLASIPSSSVLKLVLATSALPRELSARSDFVAAATPHHCAATLPPCWGAY